MEEIERWVPVSGYERYYEVSNLGRVKRFDRKKIFKGHKHKSGYINIKLTKDTRISYSMHRLVYLSFNKLPLNYNGFIDHIDSNKLNNNLDNLRLCSSRKENASNPASIKKNSIKKRKVSYNYDTTDLPNEIWSKELDCISMTYQASNLGRVKVHYTDKCSKKKRDRILNVYTREDEYQSVMINGNKRLLHRFIWFMWNGEIPEGCQIDHINSIRDDNRIENLRLVSTTKENMQNEETKQKYKTAIYQLDPKTEDIIREFDSEQEACGWLLSEHKDMITGKLAIYGRMSNAIKTSKELYGSKWARKKDYDKLIKEKSNETRD